MPPTLARPNRALPVRQLIEARVPDFGPGVRGSTGSPRTDQQGVPFVLSSSKDERDGFQVHLIEARHVHDVVLRSMARG